VYLQLSKHYVFWYPTVAHILTHSVNLTLGATSDFKNKCQARTGVRDGLGFQNEPRLQLCGGHLGLTVWNLLNYTKIENMHKVRKKTFVFIYVDICTTTGGTEQIRACVPLWLIRPNCPLMTKLDRKWCTHCKHRCAAVLAYTQRCHIKNRSGIPVVHQKVS